MSGVVGFCECLGVRRASARTSPASFGKTWGRADAVSGTSCCLCVWSLLSHKAQPTEEPRPKKPGWEKKGPAWMWEPVGSPKRRPAKTRLYPRGLTGGASHTQAGWAVLVLLGGCGTVCPSSREQSISRAVKKWLPSVPHSGPPLGLWQAPGKAFEHLGHWCR